MIKRITQRFGFTLLLSLLLTVTATVTATTANATDTSNANTYTNENPYQLIEQVADATFKRIAADKDKIAQDPNHLKLIVGEELMPHIDHRYAARVVLYKIKASKADRQAFYQAFEQYLITTYATVFAKYTNQKVVFDPAKDFDGKKMVLVKSRIINEDGPDMDIDFKVRTNKKTGIWKAYDLKALGVSLLDSKKAELKSLLRQQNGVSDVAQLLMKKSQSDIVIDNKAGS